MDLPVPEAAPAPAKEAQGVIGVPAQMPDPAAAEVVFPGHPVAVQGAVGFDHGQDFLLQGRRHPLIRVQAEDPLAPGLVQGKILGAAKTLPGGGQHPVGIGPGQLHGAVGAARVHHHDFVGKAHRRQAFADIGLLVQGDDDDGESGHGSQ